MIIVDVETSGPSKTLCSIVSIGAIDFESLKTYYDENKVFDGALIKQEALDLNGFTREQITNSNKISLEQNVSNFIQWANQFEDKTLAGQHIGAYDSDMLKISAERYNLKWLFGYGTVDLHSLVFGHQLRSGLKPSMHSGRAAIRSEEISTYVGIPQEPKPHNALKGAVFEAEAFSRLIYGRNLLQEFSSFEIPKYLVK